MIGALLFAVLAVGAVTTSVPQTAAKPATASAAASAARAASGEAEALAAAGAPELALKLIVSSQPDFAGAPAAWAGWERTRLDVLSGAGEYQTLFARLAALPASAPASLRSYALETGARAALGDHDARRARAWLRTLIWTAPAPASAALAAYRQLVIRSYVVGGDFDDAARALGYLERSGEAGDPRTRELIAEVALARGDARAAVTALAKLDQPELQPLSLLARFEVGDLSPAQVLKQAQRGAASAEKNHDARTAGRYRLIVARAAARAGNTETQLAALLAALRTDPNDDAPFELTADGVWMTLVQSGLELGNARQLLIGDAQPWLAAAAEESKAGRPMQALALLAAAGLKGADAPGRMQALAAFADDLAAQPHGDALLLALFGDDARFARPAAIPVAVRYRLVEPAIAAGKTAFASALLPGLEVPPPGVDAGEWQLQRARLFLLGGSTAPAVALLEQLAEGKPPVAADKLLPVVLDLETLGHNAEALKILEAMLAAHPAPDMARHLLYWIGKAYSGLDAPLDAARAYLESAAFDNPHAMDQWAQTARFSAAAALTRAGLYGDARRIYAGLLNATSDPAEQALIKQRLAAVRTLANRAAEKTPGA
ncbi:MAG: tetratricopeptide repeat protein [Gammaproteobacteria bacterium]